jgi:hypothetical protein
MRLLNLQTARPMRQLIVVGPLLFALALSACRRPPAAGTYETTGEALPEPVVPAGYQKIAPAPADDSRQMLAQTSTVFRGALKDVRFTFENCAVPRTTYVFSDGSPLLGTRVDATVEVKVLGGPTPNGTWVNVTELPALALDSEYVLFLRNTDWTYSPIVGNLAFRIENIAGREVLVDPGGHAVTGCSDAGPVLSGAAVSDVVGAHRRGYRSGEPSPTSPPPEGPNSGTPVETRDRARRPRQRTRSPGRGVAARSCAVPCPGAGSGLVCQASLDRIRAGEPADDRPGRVGSAASEPRPNAKSAAA